MIYNIIYYYVDKIGSSPFPSKLLQFDSNMRKSVGSAAIWWSKIIPTNNAEESLQRVLLQGSPDEKIPSDWNMFDQTKLRKSLQIIQNCSILMRKYSSLEVAKRVVPVSSTEMDPYLSQYRLLSDIEGFITIFYKLGSLIESLQTETSPSNFEYKSSIEWLTSAQSALPSQPKNMKNSNATEVTDHLVSNLVCICENLICVIHDSLMYSNILQRQAVVIPVFVKRNEVEKIVKLANEIFPSHSFIRQVARWIVDSLESQASLTR